MNIMTVSVYVLAGLLGLCIGSFLNVVIYRVPNGMSIVAPPSHCPRCGYRLRWYDNIPLLSYLILGGKCRNCKEHISFRYTAVELLNTGLTLLSVRLFWDRSIPYAILASLLCSVLLCIFFIDLEHSLIYNVFLWIFAGLSLAMLFFDPHASLLSATGETILSSLIGGGAAAAVFFAVRAFFSRRVGKEALGDGDVFLAGIAGVLLGWQRLLLAVLIASIAGSISMLILRRVRGDEKDHEYPFAPYICAGVMFALFFGNEIIAAYLAVLGI